MRCTVPVRASTRMTWVGDQDAPCAVGMPRSFSPSAMARNDVAPAACSSAITYRHGLRAAEVVDLRWEQVDYKTGTLHVRRVKNGTPSTHPLTGRELRALRRHRRESAKSPFMFVSERGAPISAPGFSRMVERAAVSAKLGIKAHAHMLRHACGYKLANADTILARCKPTWDAEISRTPRGILRWRRVGSKVSGRIREMNATAVTRVYIIGLNDRSAAAAAWSN
jgi:hypothetical protein